MTSLLFKAYLCGDNCISVIYFDSIFYISEDLLEPQATEVPIPIAERK